MNMRPETILRLLRIIAKYRQFGCRAKELAMDAYPDSPGWTISPRRGGPPGGLVVRSAAGVIGRLREAGLVARVAGDRFVVTDAGYRYLNGIGDRKKLTSTNAAPTNAATANPHGFAQHFPALRPMYCPQLPGHYLWLDAVGNYFWRDAYGSFIFGAGRPEG